MKIHLDKKGSAILLVLVVISTLVPITLGLISLDTSLGQNSRRVIDTKLSQNVLSGAIEELKAKLLADKTATSYYVDVTTNTRNDGTIDLNNIDRSHNYYAVKPETGYYLITSYYAGIKHSYKLVYQDPAANSLDNSTLFIRGNKNPPEPARGYYIYDKQLHHFYNWQKKWDTVTNGSNSDVYSDGNLQIFDLENPTKPRMIMGAGETEFASGRPIIAANNFLLSQSSTVEIGSSGKYGTITKATVGEQPDRATISTKVVGQGALYTHYETASINESDPADQNMYTIYYECGNNRGVSCITGMAQISDRMAIYKKDSAMTLSYDFPISEYYSKTTGFGDGEVPRNLHVYTVNGKVYGVYAAGTRGVGVVNITDRTKANMKVIYSSGTTKDMVNDAVYSNGFLYLATVANGLVSLPVTNIDTLATGPMVPYGELFGNLAVNSNGTELYASRNDTSQPNRNGLYVFDISTGVAKRKIAAKDWKTPDRQSVNGEKIAKLYFDKITYSGTAYNALIAGTFSSDTFVIYDAAKLASDPDHAIIKRAPVIGEVSDFAYINEGVLEERLYVASSSGIQSIDTTTVGNSQKVNFPRVIDTYYTNMDSKPFKIATYKSGSNKYLYAVSNQTGNNKLTIFNITDQDNIGLNPATVDLGAVLTQNPYQMEIKNDKLYLLLKNKGLYVYDLANPDNPTFNRSFDLAKPTRMAINATGDCYILAEVSARPTIMKILSDLSPATSFKTLTVSTTKYTNISANNTHIYVSDNDKTITKIEIINRTPSYQSLTSSGISGFPDSSTDVDDKCYAGSTSSNQSYDQTGIKVFCNDGTSRFIKNKDTVSKNTTFVDLYNFSPEKTIMNNAGLTSAVDNGLNGGATYIRIIRKFRNIGGSITPTFEITKLY